MRKTLTPKGFARVLVRAVRTSFAPEYQNAELERLAEMLDELAMSRAMEGETMDLPAERQQADIDADILDAVASELEDAAQLKAR